MDDKLAVTIRQTTIADLPGVIDLQHRAFPDMPHWNLEDLTSHLSIFPEGQLVAVDQAGRILGSASALIIDWDDYLESAKWSSITGHGTVIPLNDLIKDAYDRVIHCIDNSSGTK